VVRLPTAIILGSVIFRSQQALLEVCNPNRHTLAKSGGVVRCDPSRPAERFRVFCEARAIGHNATLPTEMRIGSSVLPRVLLRPNARRKAATPLAHSLGDRVLRKPITGIAACCAYAASGHGAAAPLNSVMKSRRFTASCLLTERTAHSLTCGRRLLRCGISLPDHGVVVRWCDGAWTSTRPQSGQHIDAGREGNLFDLEPQLPKERNSRPAVAESPCRSSKSFAGRRHAIVGWCNWRWDGAAREGNV
jgi:hypothetical protein